MSAQPKSRRRSFTLVEMLTVVVIIGILAGLITAAAMRARVFARRTVVRNEISELESALTEFKNKFGAYPPDMTDDVAMQRFFAKAFPRYAYTKNQFKADVGNALPINGSGTRTDFFDTLYQNPSAALLFWLGGIPEYAKSATNTDALDASSKRIISGFTGFSANPRNPFQQGGSRIAPFYSFEIARAKRVATADLSAYCYVQRGSDPADTEPYLYFAAPYFVDANSDGLPQLSEMPYWANGSRNIYPCFDTGPNGDKPYNFANPTTFQIRGPGTTNGLHGTGTNYPVGTDNATNTAAKKYDPDQHDDMSNFTKGVTFEDDLP